MAIVTTTTRGKAVKESQAKDGKKSEPSSAEISTTNRIAKADAADAVATIARRVLCHQDRRVQLSNRISFSVLRNQTGFGVD